ncbi:MAG: DUF1501 domain-containing protein [Myxococcota bacterium]
MSTFNKGSALTRRHLLRSASLGSLALQSVATGLPVGLLMRPRVGRTQADPMAEGPGRMLILFASQAGDPINTNVPGTYGSGAEGVVHPPSMRMAPTALQLDGRTYTAAKPWADLPQAVLDKTVFFHHATYTPVHQDHAEVMRLMGASRDDQMLVTMLATLLAPRQGSVQSVPLSLGARSGAELVTNPLGQPLANVAPLSLAQALGGPRGPLASLTGLRDRGIDRLYRLYRDHGTEHDRNLLDAWARSRDEVRSVSDVLVSRLEVIEDNREDSQVTAASVLAAMNITPVITVHGRFGGDNHRDEGLVSETDQTISGVARMGRLMAELDVLRAQGVLRHDVVVATMNVFGRNLRKKGTAGRDHNRGHHVTVMMGDGLRGGVVGGIERSGDDYIASSINSTTGEAVGDVPFDETLAAMAKTMGRAVGVEASALDENISLGRPVMSALT